jgi:hypothetical protein
VVKDETTDEFGFSGHLVLHVHYFYHVKIDPAISCNCLDCINDYVAQGVGECGRDLGVQGSAGNLEKQVAAHFFWHFKSFKELQALSLTELEAINNNAGVDSFAKVALSLTHKFSNEEDVCGGAVSDDVVLGGSSATNHSGSRVLDLHFVEQDSSIFGELDLACTANEPKYRLKFVQESSSI